MPLLLHLHPLLRLALQLRQALSVQLFQLWIIQQVVYVHLGIGGPRRRRLLRRQHLLRQGKPGQAGAIGMSS